MSSDQMPAPGKTKLIKFPPSRAGKDVKCPGYARGGGGVMFKLRFDWYITPCTFTSPTKMTIFLGTVRSTNDNKMSKVHARSHEITNKPLRVRTTKTL